MAEATAPKDLSNLSKAELHDLMAAGLAEQDFKRVKDRLQAMLKGEEPKSTRRIAPTQIIAESGRPPRVKKSKASPP